MGVVSLKRSRHTINLEERVLPVLIAGIASSLGNCGLYLQMSDRTSNPRLLYGKSPSMDGFEREFEHCVTFLIIRDGAASVLIDGQKLPEVVVKSTDFDNVEKLARSIIEALPGLPDPAKFSSRTKRTGGSHSQLGG